MEILSGALLAIVVVLGIVFMFVWLNDIARGGDGDDW